MEEIVTEHSGSILRVQLNRPAKRNAMTSAMYLSLASIFKEAGTDENTRVILWHGAGDSFCAGNDIEDFLKNPPGPGESPQAGLMQVLVNLDKPLVAAVHGAAIGGGTTMLTHCDFIYAGESTKFQMPFINLAVVPEFGSSCSVPSRIGHLRAAELLLLGASFDARRAADLGLVTEVASDKDVLARATDTARKLAAKPAAALQASKKLMKQPFREQIKAAMKAENEEFSVQVRSEDAKEALTRLPGKTQARFHAEHQISSTCIGRRHDLADLSVGTGQFLQQFLQTFAKLDRDDPILWKPWVIDGEAVQRRAMRPLSRIAFRNRIIVRAGFCRGLLRRVARRRSVRIGPACHVGDGGSSEISRELRCPDR